ncbi:5-hydroxytryptamine receptor 3C-like [Garra rufa]|uniref:5-hydroxytryptamine receptor 3C-like n=1 Tax=Garra rufa TaxID=137080 RepID=UPI003CCEB792
MAVVLFSRPQAAGSTAMFPHFQLMICCLIMQSLLMKSTETISCSEPTTDGLLTALKQNIFSKTEIRPVINLKTPTNISVTFTLYGILDVDEKAQKLNTFLWVNLFWNIEGLSWDPDECGTDRISIPRKQLWRPDIIINEFIDENKVPDTYYLYLAYTGKVVDDLPFHVISSCNLDIYTFPFDIQNCTFTFNSYQHTVLDVQLSFAEPVEETFKSSLEAMTTKGEWELVDMLAEKPTIPPHEMNNSRDMLTYYIVLRRRATLYVVNLLIPSCFLITVDLFSFLLPPQSVDRSAFKMTLILGYTVFLLLMNDLLPVTGNNLPLINAFFSLCLALMVASLLETILIINIQCGSTHYGPLPRWAKVLFLNYVAKLVRLSKKTNDQNCDPEERRTETKRCDPPFETSQSEATHKTPALLELKKISHELQSIRQQVDKQLKTDESADEWVHLGQVIDRLLFCLYIVFLSVSFITIVVFWIYWYRKNASLI